MSEDIYQVERDDYVGFVRQLKPDSCDMKVIENSDYTIAEMYSKLTGALLCSRKVPVDEDAETLYYIYTMPEPSERQAAKPVRKLRLETREEVQAFFDVISKIYKENDRTVS